MELNQETNVDQRQQPTGVASGILGGALGSTVANSPIAGGLLSGAANNPSFLLGPLGSRLAGNPLVGGLLGGALTGGGSGGLLGLASGVFSGGATTNKAALGILGKLF